MRSIEGHTILTPLIEAYMGAKEDSTPFARWDPGPSGGDSKVS